MYGFFLFHAIFRWTMAFQVNVNDVKQMKQFQRYQKWSCYPSVYHDTNSFTKKHVCHNELFFNKSFYFGVSCLNCFGYQTKHVGCQHIPCQHCIGRV